jgi:ferrous iron transport protein B
MAVVPEEVLVLAKEGISVENNKTIHVALAGNPNSGKTSIFNCLAGTNQKVGNFSGVTVEKVEGTFKYKGHTIRLVDLPGTYSLSPYSPEEKVARDYILNEKPDFDYPVNGS